MVDMEFIQIIKNKILIAGIGLCYIFLSTSSVRAQEYDTKKYAAEIKAFDKKDSLEGLKPGANLFTGSSTLRMWPDMQSYFPGALVMNRGFGGSTFRDLLYYTDRLILGYKPAKVFIYEGDNDIAAGVSVEETLKQAIEIRERIAKSLPGVPVAFIGVKPSIARWHLKEKYIDFNSHLEDYCKKTRNTAFIDVWNPMLDDHGAVRPVFLKDNLHMNAEGYQIWKEAIAPYLIPKKKI